MRRNLLRVHRWTGIALAGFLVLAGATGSFFAFHHEIDATLVPELHDVSPQPARARLDAIATEIEAARPHLTVGYFVFSQYPDKAMRAVLNTREAAAPGGLIAKAPAKRRFTSIRIRAGSSGSDAGARSARRGRTSSRWSTGCT